jgi:hypothetical protein
VSWACAAADGRVNTAAELVQRPRVRSGAMLANLIILRGEATKGLGA